MTLTSFSTWESPAVTESPFHSIQTEMDGIQVNPRIFYDELNVLGMKLVSNCHSCIKCLFSSELQIGIHC